MKYVLPALLFLAALAPAARAQDAREKGGRSCCVFPPSRRPLGVALPGGGHASLRLRRAGATVWYETAEGHPVLRDGERWVYARLDGARRLRATDHELGSADPEQAGIARGVRPAATPLSGPGRQTVSTTGVAKNLVIALRFADHGPAGQNRVLPSQSDLDVIWNQAGGHPVLAPTGSVRDAWLENSYGVFTFDSTVVAWFDVPNTESFYAAGSYGLSTTVWDLVRDGLDAVDPVVNFAQFDQDADGRIDTLTVLHSGYGAEFGGVDQYGTADVDRIWSHRWAISPPWVSAEGVRVEDYSISPGLWDVTGSDPVRIGVLTHELAHILGLPDLYDTDGSSEGSGNWELMAGGAWAVDDQQYLPSHLSAWSKWHLGWLEPRMLEEGPQELQPVELFPDAGLIPGGYGVGECLLLENRGRIGLDALLPAEGLALWHVDGRKGSVLYNDPNNDEGYPSMPGVPLWPYNDLHYRLALLAPDDAWDLETFANQGDSGDLWPWLGFDRADNTTSPSTSAYQGGTILETGNVLEHIVRDDATQLLSFEYSNAERPVITTASLPPASQAVAYGHQLLETSGIGPFLWSEWIEEPSYTSSVQATSSFFAGGVAQGWHDDDAWWFLQLPFAFPYWETAYDLCVVSSNGFLDFVPVDDSETFGSADHLPFFLRIAPLWTDLTTTLAGDDVFVDTGVAGQVTIRWLAHTWGSASPCNFSVTLFEDGRIRFDYGSGNVLDDPATVGIGRGHSADSLIVPGYDGKLVLTSAQSVNLARQGSQLPPGLLVDGMGLIHGIPLASGTFQPTFVVSDEVRNCDRITLDLEVVAGTGVQNLRRRARRL